MAPPLTLTDHASAGESRVAHTHEGTLSVGAGSFSSTAIYSKITFIKVCRHEGERGEGWERERDRHTHIMLLQRDFHAVSTHHVKPRAPHVANNPLHNAHDWLWCYLNSKK